MAKDEYLQLAHVYSPDKYHVAGFYESEKLDGQRAFWDGGISRGIPASEVPYANTVKDDRYETPQVSTGLFSRYGKAIQAPKWWLDQLPPFPVDGELWAGRGTFQFTSSVVRSSVNIKDADWNDIYFLVFDTPAPESAFRHRRVHPNPNVDFTIKPGAVDWWKQRSSGTSVIKPATSFRTRHRYLQLNLTERTNVKLHVQRVLPHATDAAKALLEKRLDEVLEQEGEGLMLKAPHDLWLPERVHTLLKYKPWQDSEASVVGYRTGRETELGSKLLGLMGSLILFWKDGPKGPVEFKLSGFTDAERILESKERDATQWARENPDQICPDDIYNPLFPKRSEITFKYRELTKDGVPKEARFLRKHES